MIYIDEGYNTNTEFPTILQPYFDGLTVGVFDIETTGLSPDFCHFILGGLGQAKEGGLPEGELRIRQFFAESRHEEEAALDRCLLELSKIDAVITYNGTRFDMPFLKRRAAEYGFDAMYDIPHNFDLYHMINKFSELRKILPNLKQKTVETFFGLWDTRSDEIDGGESVALYEIWERWGERTVLEKILLHNSDDVMQLTKLIPIVRKADVHRAMSNIGFPVNHLTVNGIRIELTGNDSSRAAFGGRLLISGIQRHRPHRYYSYALGEHDCDIAFDDKSAEFYCAVPLRRAGSLVVLDLDRLLPEHEELLASPFYESGFLVIKQEEHYQYAEINHFIRLFLKRILEEF